MRLKIEGNIVEKTKKYKTNYKHETYSMLLNNLPYNNAQEMHTDKKMFRLLSFTNIYIHQKQDKFHFYICGEDILTEKIIERLSFNELIKIDDMILKITKISPIDNLKEKNEYIFKSNIIVNISKDNKCELTNDLDFLCKRINTIAKDKYKKIYGRENNNNITVEILSVEKILNKYKNHHIYSWKSKVKLKGDYELINLLYNVGIGENTASGHGFLWEV